MKIKFCLPLIAKSANEVSELIDKNPEYDFYEIWLDYIDHLTENFAPELIKKYKDKNFIFLLRRKNLESTKMRSDLKLKIIESIKDLNSLLDLDINDQITELEYLNSNKINIRKIISYHNYNETPDEEELIKIINFMNKFNPSVVKIAAKCKNAEDAIRLMTLIHILNEKKLEFIVTGMGTQGKIARVYGMLNGNYVNFAPNDKNNLTADGQILKKDLQTIADIFDNK